MHHYTWNWEGCDLWTSTVQTSTREDVNTVELGLTDLTCVDLKESEMKRLNLLVNFPTINHL